MFFRTCYRFLGRGIRRHYWTSGGLPTFSFPNLWCWPCVFLVDGLVWKQSCTQCHHLIACHLLGVGFSWWVFGRFFRDLGYFFPTGVLAAGFDLFLVVFGRFEVYWRLLRSIVGAVLAIFSGGAMFIIYAGRFFDAQAINTRGHYTSCRHFHGNY